MFDFTAQALNFLKSGLYFIPEWLKAHQRPVSTGPEVTGSVPQVNLYRLEAKYFHFGGLR